VVQSVRKDSGIMEFVRETEKEFLGDVTGKRVLEIGAGSGCGLTRHLATSAGYYLAVDLAERPLERLRENLRKWNAPNAEAVQMDFLSGEFPYQPFDVVFASSVIHAFHPLEPGVRLIHERLIAKGHVVCMEPMDTSWALWCAWRIFRPFRSDANWVFPLNRESFHTIQGHFEVEAVQGFFGCSKWALPLALVPLLYPAAVKFARRLHERDRRCARFMGRGLWGCNSVVMRLRRRS
jgi:SAM-dependent methyltransferase